ncbi:MAG: rhodanese-like domain-containing protein [Gammaproteobacteria bacterium]|nr:rhodanese-like domain-containing protein [Gammaproteobacteria bacterium]
MAKTLADFVRKARARIHEISIEEFDEMIENHDDVLVMDVREAEEFNRGHIPGALLVPRGILEGAADTNSPMRVDKLCGARTSTIIVCSQNSARGALAADTLQQMGFQKVYLLVDGIDRWEAQGLALARD